MIFVRFIGCDMASKWADYGFPDNLHLAKPELVATGLMLALKERVIASGFNLDFTALELEPLKKRKDGSVAGRAYNWCLQFDMILNNIVHLYYDFESDITDIKLYPGLTHPGMADFLGETPIYHSYYTGGVKLYRLFSLEWVLQRYKLLNLMRRCVVNFSGTGAVFTKYDAQVRSTANPAWQTGSNAVSSYVASVDSGGSYLQIRSKGKYQWGMDATDYTFGTGVVVGTGANQTLPGTVFTNPGKYIQVDDFGNVQGLAAGEYFDINQYYLESDLDAARTAPEGFYANAYIFPRICGDVEGGF